MLVYIILLAVSVGAGIPLCSKKCGRWGKPVYCVVMALLFTFISAVRFQVGYDFNSYGGEYYNMMFRTVEDVEVMRMEKGFTLPMYIFNLAFEDYWVVFVYTSIIICFSVFGLIYKRSSMPWVSVCAFLCFGAFFNSLCFLRQFIAAIVICYAIKYTEKKFSLRFFALVLAASAFHWSALILMGLYFLLKIKPSYIYLGIAAAGTVIFCFVSRPVLKLLTEKFYMYRGYDPYTSAEMTVGLPVRYTVMFGLLFAVCFLFRKRLMEKNPQNGVYINCLMFTAIFEAMGTRHAILSRFAILTYLPALLFLLPDAVKIIGEFVYEKKGNIARISSAAAAAVFSAGCYLILIINNYNGVYPYVSQFNRPYDIFEDIVADEDDDFEDLDDEDYEDDGDYEDDDYSEDSEEDISGEDESDIIDLIQELQ